MPRSLVIPLVSFGFETGGDPDGAEPWELYTKIPCTFHFGKLALTVGAYSPDGWQHGVYASSLLQPHPDGWTQVERILAIDIHVEEWYACPVKGFDTISATLKFLKPLVRLQAFVRDSFFVACEKRNMKQVLRRLQDASWPFRSL